MPKIIIVCGAGGKTSYINKLSKKYKDKNVVITTTAKIFKPDKYIETIDSYSFDNDNIIVLGKEYDEKKLMYAKDDELIKAINFADVIIIESDSIYDEIINKEFENKDYYAFLESFDIFNMLKYFYYSHKNIGCMFTEERPSNPAVFSYKYINDILSKFLSFYFHHI